MFDSLLVFAQGVTKMDFDKAFHPGGNNLSCKHEQVQHGVQQSSAGLSLTNANNFSRPGAMDHLFTTI